MIRIAMSRRESLKAQSVITRSKTQVRKKPGRKPKVTKAKSPSPPPVTSPHSTLSPTTSEDNIDGLLELIEPPKSETKSRRGSRSTTPSISPASMSTHVTRQMQCLSPTESDDEIFNLLKINVPKKKKKGGVKAPPKPKLLKKLFSEYYPQKLKRPVPEKKPRLQHKFNLKLVSRRNKRKSMFPRKECIDIIEDSERIVYSELGVPEIIRALEAEGHDLDEEDILEIATCPSPVWWEEPPDESYDEEPIDKLIIKEAMKVESPVPFKQDVQLRVNEIHRCNDKFLQKKSKLEQVLGNIKTKKAGDVQKEVINESIERRDTRTSESSEGDVLSDISVNDYEGLKNLEKIVIPVEKIGEGC